MKQIVLEGKSTMYNPAHLPYRRSVGYDDISTSQCGVVHISKLPIPACSEEPSVTVGLDSAAKVRVPAADLPQSLTLVIRIVQDQSQYYKDSQQHKAVKKDL